MRTALAIILVLSACSGDDGGPRPTQYGGDRPADLKAPPTLTPGKKYPLLVVLHGYGANGFVQTAFFGVGGLPAADQALLIAPDGAIDGKYRKVHLATGGEDTSGVLPGDGFPVYETEVGRIGCNICKDSSAAESSRMVGLNGADFLLLPIMGDHRADRWSVGTPIYSESRWLAIMRTRAMDNQHCMVVARNTAQGSCIIDRKGDVLAWNEGDQDFIQATVTLDDGYRSWNGGCFRGINWMQRRPHVYGAFVDAYNRGGLR
jgi:hypothetical protein